MDLLAASVDYKHAYKNIAIGRDQAEFTHILLAPPTGPSVVSRVLALPFGSRRSPSNWARIASFLNFVLGRLSSLTLSMYVDDCFAAEPRAAADAALLPINSLNEALGYPLGKEKECKPNATIELLGAEIPLVPKRIDVLLPTRKRNELAHDLRRKIQRDRLTPAGAA